MAKIDYNSWQEYNNKKEYANKVSFLQIKNDGDSAIVRFMDSNLSDPEIIALHTIPEGNKFKKLSCLRTTPYEPTDVCPLCDSGNKVQQRVFVKLIQYVKEGEEGAEKIVPKCCVWERPAMYINKLRGLADEYGDLSTLLFKIVRHGTGKETTYDDPMLLFGSKYPAEKYPTDATPFNGYSALGGLVKEVKYNDMQAMINGKTEEKTEAEVPVPKMAKPVEQTIQPEEPKVEPMPTIQQAQLQRRPWEVPTSTPTEPQSNEATMPRRPRFY